MSLYYITHTINGELSLKSILTDSSEREWIDLKPRLKVNEQLAKARGSRSSSNLAEHCSWCLQLFCCCCCCYYVTIICLRSTAALP